MYRSTFSLAKTSAPPASGDNADTTAQGQSGEQDSGQQFTDGSVQVRLYMDEYGGSRWVVTPAGIVIHASKDGKVMSARISVPGPVVHEKWTEAAYAKPPPEVVDWLKQAAVDLSSALTSL